MNAFEFGRALFVKVAAPPSMISGAARPAAPAAPKPDPQAALNAQRVAQVKAEAAKVRAASGTPSIMGNGAGGSWSGRVMPNGDVQGAKFTPPAGQSPPVRHRMATPPPAAATTQQPDPYADVRKKLEAYNKTHGAFAPRNSTPAAQTTRPTATQMQPNQGGQFQEEYQKWRQTQGGNQPPMPPASSSAPNTTTTPVDGAALKRQMDQMRMIKTPATATSPAPPVDPARDQALTKMRDRFVPQQPQGGGGPAPAVQPQGPVAAGGHIIRTDNGRLFDTIQKRFIEPPKGAVFGPPGAQHGPALPPR